MASRRDPSRSRPRPRGYFAEQDEGMLPWRHVVEELKNARNYWVATVGPDGMPHAMPVWAVCQSGALFFDSVRFTTKS